MKSLTIFILSYVSLTLSSPYRRKQDWFWNKDFKDNSEHDNDESRQFFRSSTKNHNEATKTSTPTSSHRTITVDPDYSTTDKTTTESIDSEERFPTTIVHETTVDWVKAHYQERKSTEIVLEPQETKEDNFYHGTYSFKEIKTEKEIKWYLDKIMEQALTCKENEHIKTRLDENRNPNPDCQLCTCDGKGMLMCTRISCSDSDLDTKKQHELILSKTGSHNLILREYATGCKPGTAVVADKLCTCFCVLPSVMSCPKDCLDTDHEDSRDSEDDEAKIEITTENDEAKIEITTENDESKIEKTTENEEAKLEKTTEGNEAEFVTNNGNDKVKPKQSTIITATYVLSKELPDDYFSDIYEYEE